MVFRSPESKVNPGKVREAFQLFVLGVGIYAGIYIDQNYTVPRVDDPKALWQKVRDFMEQHKKDLPKPPSSS